MAIPLIINKKKWVHFDGNYVDCVMSTENIVKHERKNFLSVLQCYCLINKWRLDVVNISFVCFGILCCVDMRSVDICIRYITFVDIDGSH